MASKTLPLTWIDGRTTDSSEYTRTGHSQNGTEQKDAMWSFVAPTNRIKKLTIPFEWDNGTGGTGNWGTNVTMYVSITTDGRYNSSYTDEYRLAANTDPKRIDQVTIAVNGNSGSNTAVFNDLELEAGTIYYIRVNAADNVSSSIKCFKKAIDATYEKRSGVRIKVKGEWKEGTSLVKVKGAWKEGTSRVHADGSWHEGI